jgi:hypothetical protein
MPRESETMNVLSNRSKSDVEDVTLTASEACRLIGICIELIDLCSRVTGKIDPAVGSIVGYARDEALAEALEIRS